MGNDQSASERNELGAGGRQSPPPTDWAGCKRERELRLLTLLTRTNKQSGEIEWAPIGRLLAMKKYFPLGEEEPDGGEEQTEVVVVNDEEMIHETADHPPTRNTTQRHSFSFHFRSNELDPAYCTDEQTAAELTCPICLKLYQSPVLVPCSHHICRPCLTTLRAPYGSNVERRFCPLCGIAFELHETEPAYDIKQRVEALEISCPYRDLGCPAVLTIGLDSRNLFQHLLHDCQYQVASCNACGKVLNRQQRLEHECLVIPRSVTASSLTTTTTSTSTSALSITPANVLSASRVLHVPPLSTHQLRQLPVNRFCLRDCGFTILHQAVALASPKFIRCLLEHGALPNVRSRRSLAGPTERGRINGLCYYRPHTKFAHTLVPIPNERIPWSMYGDRMKRNLISPIVYRELGFTPLMLAVMFADDSHVCQICEILFLGGADVNATTTNLEWTAGLFAAQRGLPALWSLILDHGADLHHRNTDGQDALEVARVWGHMDDRDMISEEGERRRLFRVVTEEVLGDQFCMAEVCIQICLEYISVK